MSYLLAALLLLAPTEYLQQLEKGKECKSCTMAKEVESDLLVFMSFSMPDATWIDLSLPLEKAGGVFVVRGLPQNSFDTLMQNVVRLREAGVMAQIDLDPTLFDQYRIEATPTVVLREQGRFDKLSGNIGLEATLEIMKEQGETNESARSLLQKIRGAA